MSLVVYKEKICTCINSLSERERLLILLTFLSLLYITTIYGIAPGFQATEERLNKDITLMQQRIATRKEDIHHMLQQFQQNSDTAKRARVRELTAQLNKLGLQWQNLNAGLVSPREMIRLVESILTKRKRLDIIRLENIPATPLQVSGDDPADEEYLSEKTNTETDPNNIYKHGLLVMAKGRYRDIVSFLRDMEKLKWRVIWGGLKLTSESPPLSTVSLTIYTLSFNETLIEI